MKKAKIGMSGRHWRLVVVAVAIDLVAWSTARVFDMGNAPGDLWKWALIGVPAWILLGLGW